MMFAFTTTLASTAPLSGPTFVGTRGRASVATPPTHVVEVVQVRRRPRLPKDCSTRRRVLIHPPTLASPHSQYDLNGNSKVVVALDPSLGWYQVCAGAVTHFADPTIGPSLYYTALAESATSSSVFAIDVAGGKVPLATEEIPQGIDRLASG